MVGKRNILSNNLQNIVFGNIKGIVKSDVISPLSNMMTGVVAEYGREFIEKREETKKLNAELEKLNRASAAGEERGNGAPKVNKYSDKSQYTESGRGANNGKNHVVAKGDTLWGIAVDNDKTVEDMLKANPHLKMDKNGFVLIKAGDQLAIPDGAVTQPRSASGGGAAAKQGQVSAGTPSVISKIDQPKVVPEKTSYDSSNKQHKGKRQIGFHHDLKIDDNGAVENNNGHFMLNFQMPKEMEKVLFGQNRDKFGSILTTDEKDRYEKAVQAKKIVTKYILVDEWVLKKHTQLLNIGKKIRNFIYRI